MGKLLISASEAARIIGCGAQKVREHLKHGVWTFGQYVPKEQSGSSRGEYLINRAALMKYLGLEEKDSA